MLNVTNIPAPRVPFTDPTTGLITREWYRYLFNLFLLTGGGSSDTTIQDLQLGPITPNVQDQIDQIRQEAALSNPPQQLGTLAAVDAENVRLLKFNNYPSPTPGTTAGTMSWNDTGGLDIHMGVPGDHTGLSNITQQVGEELYVYGKASATISDSPLQAIYKTGTVGSSGVITFAPTIAGITDNGAIIGVATENIAVNSFGRITAFGVVHNITTNGSAYGETWHDGDDIWYNPVTGGLTRGSTAYPSPQMPPPAPGIKVKIGTVIKAGPGGSGSFQVLLQPGSILGETDSNVQITSVANGDFLQYYSAGGYWRNVASTSVGVTSFSAGTTGFTPNTATTGAVTLAGTLATTNGGTGLTSFTTGGLVYASSTSTLVTNTSISWNGVTLSLNPTSTGSYTIDAGGNTIAIGTKTANPGYGGSVRLRDDTATERWSFGLPGSAGATSFAIIDAVASSIRFAIDSSGNITTAVPIGGSAGGTGVNNGSSKITIGGNVTYSGAYTFTGTLTGNTSVTFPTSGTLATTSNTVASFSAGTTGFTPNTATTGAITLAGTLAATNGGTGVNNGSNTITLGGNFTTSGAFATTLTVTGATNVTLPTSGTLATTANTVASFSGGSTGLTPNTATTGAVTLGGILGSTYGGTGVNNGSSTITIGGNVTYSGAYTFTGTLTANTSVTFPTSGTLVSYDANGNTSITGTAVMGTSFLRNRLINGRFAIDQRNAAASQTITAGAALAYTVDRWYAYCTGANVTGQQVAGTAPAQFAYKFTGATSNTLVGFGQRIEQLNSYDLASGAVTITAYMTASTNTTITWYLYGPSSTANTFGTIASPAVTQIATGTFSVTTSRTKFTAAVSAASMSGFNKGLELRFVAASGLGNAVTWTTEDVQLEAGTASTPTECRQYGQELVLCQRYYWANSSANYTGFQRSAADTLRFATIFCPVSMRVAPTVTATWDGGTGPTNDSITVLAWRSYVTQGDTVAARFISAVTASAEMTT